MHVRTNSGSLDLFIGRIQPPIANIVHDIRMEQRRILRDHANSLSEGIQLNLGDVLSVDKNPAGGGLVEPVKQTEDGRLAASGWTDDGNLLARRDGE